MKFILFIALIIVSVWFYRDHKFLTHELYITDLCAENAKSIVEDFSETYAWTSYEEMGRAIEDLTILDCSAV